MAVFPGRHWGDWRLAPATALAVVGTLGMIDDVFNSLLTPIFPAIAGSLGGLYLTVLAARRVSQRSSRPAAMEPAAASSTVKSSAGCQSPRLRRATIQKG